MPSQPLPVGNHLTTFSRKRMSLNGNQSHTKCKKYPVKAIVILCPHVVILTGKSNFCVM